MGNNITKPNKTSIKVPNGHILVKIATLNVDLYNFITANDRITIIMDYIFNNKCDVICLQGITDLNIGLTLIKRIKHKCSRKNIDLYFSPSFDEIDTNDTKLSSKQMFDISWGKRQSYSKYSKLFVKNIIISRFPIKNIMIQELDKETDIDDLLGVQTLVGADIIINDRIVPMYCTSLSKDIKTTDIINNDVRRTEMNEIMKFIRDRNSKYSFIMGSFNINEINDNVPNDEFIEMIQKHKLIDIYRYKNDNVDGFTTNHMERNHYIFIILRKNKTFDDVNKLLNNIYRKYGIYFIECSVNTNIIVGKNHPVESIFMIKKNEK